jgi:hypothetical protein
MANKSNNAEKAFMLWWHYQLVIMSGKYKNETHKKIVINNEHYWREEWLKETEPFKDSIMLAAGFTVIDNKRGIYSIV